VKTTAKGINEASHHGTKHQPCSNPHQNFTISFAYKMNIEHQNNNIIIEIE